MTDPEVKRVQAEALREALAGEPGTPPNISPLAWLDEAIAELKRRGPGNDCEDPDAFWTMVNECEALERSGRAALAALPEAPAVPVGVKPLIWEKQNRDGTFWASELSVTGMHKINFDGKEWVASRGIVNYHRAASCDDAKAAAQRFHEDRILSALTPTAIVATPPAPTAAVDGRLYDDNAYMADGEVRMTAAEDVLAWLLIEKIGVPDDMNYTPKEAQDILAHAIDQLHGYEDASAIKAHLSPGTGEETDDTLNDIAAENEAGE